MSTPEAAVSIKDVSKQFKAGVTALTGIDLEVRPREFISLIGPSGCGKSTLLRIIGDLIEPSSGTVEVNGKPAHRARIDHDYGIVFQEAVLYDWRTVSKNIALPLELLKWSREKRSARVSEMIDLVELEGFENHHPWQLSGGMQQRVSIARALSFDPALLLMDEPFGALDEMTRERLNLELLRIWDASGSTIVFVTHSIPEAVFLSTRVVVMSARPGRIAGIVEIDLPQPRAARTREEPRFFELVTEVRERLAAVGADVLHAEAEASCAGRPSSGARLSGAPPSASSCWASCSGRDSSPHSTFKSSCSRSRP
jgi:NitT/TauT family transport system ATP-binding protein